MQLNIWPTQGLITAKGTIKVFNRTTGKLDFIDQNGERHEINVNQHSLVSHEHGLHYHASNPAFNHKTEIAFSIVKFGKELLSLKNDSIKVLKNTIQYEMPENNNIQIEKSLNSLRPNILYLKNLVK